MNEAPQCPLPTPELVAALANQFIEEAHTEFVESALKALDPGHLSSEDRTRLPECMDRAELLILGAVEGGERVGALRTAAWELAFELNFPAPYETQVTLNDGVRMAPERHTITHFSDGEPGTDGLGFDQADLMAIHALGVGESYVVAGQAATMTVTRKE